MNLPAVTFELVLETILCKSANLDGFSEVAETVGDSQRVDELEKRLIHEEAGAIVHGSSGVIGAMCDPINAPTDDPSGGLAAADYAQIDGEQGESDPSDDITPSCCIH